MPVEEPRREEGGRLDRAQNGAQGGDGSKHYRMLRKAHLARDLFGEEADPEPAKERVQPEPEPTLDLPEVALPEMTAEPELPEATAASVSVLPDDPLAQVEERAIVVEPPVEAPEATPVEQAPPVVAVADPAAAPEAAPSTPPSVDWRAELGELIAAELPANLTSLGLCACRKDPGSATVAAMLARWIADCAQSPTLLLEANAYKPRMTRLLRARRSGLTEILFDRSSREEVISQWEEDPLKVLPLGRNLDRKRRKGFGERLAEALPELRRGFDQVLLELPAADDGAFKRFPFTDTVDAVLLVADPKRTSRKEIERAAKRLRKLDVPLLGCLMDATGSAGAARLSQGSRSVQR